MKNFLFRIFIMTIGLVFFAVGIVLTIKANIGLAPWDVFHEGVSKTLGISFGIASIAVGVVILLLLILLKEKFGIGSLSNMILIGIFIDIILYLDFIPVFENIVICILILIAGLFSVALGSYYYIKSGFGVGPRDNLMVVLTRATKIPVGICRSIIELAVCAGGYFLGGTVGIGTIISVVGIGFCVQIVFRIFKFDITKVKHESLRETFESFNKNL